MQLFRKPTEGTNAADGSPGSAGMLFDRSLLARWFVLYRLVEEVDRAQRYDRPISVLVAKPSLLGNETLAPEALTAAAAAASRCARSTDLVGWLSDDSILIVMPETPAHDAQAAANRWQNEMWINARTQSGRKWNIVMLDQLDEFATFEKFERSYEARLKTEDAA